ncbi:MAG: hypothetical protein QGG84_06135, partial [Rhodospirillales bacterium]|nr:hypothetical protein [Rhodospirillales bacterium]
MSFYTISAGALNGLLLGGLYACMALGLSMVFGVMRFINVAHGELLILAAFLGIALVTGSVDFGIRPILTTQMGLTSQLVLMSCLLIGFGIKIP